VPTFLHTYEERVQILEGLLDNILINTTKPHTYPQYMLNTIRALAVATLEESRATD
jgi:hypothetical protein